MSGRLVYTAVMGDYDRPRPVLRRAVDTTYRFVTDSGYPEEPWERIEVSRGSQSARKFAKSIKLLPDYMFERSVWVDGNISPNFPSWGELEMTIQGNRDFALFKHPQRDCLFDEAEVCISNNLDKEKVIRKQIDRYEKEGMPRHFGLWAGGVIYRRRKDDVYQVMREWAKEIEMGSIRDQISLPYVLWKLGYEPGVIRGNLWEHSLFKYYKHR